MTGVIRWIGKWGWLILVAAGAWLVWVLRLSSKTPQRRLSLEKRAIDESEKTRLREIEHGRDQANAEIDLAYKKQIRELDERQADKAARLRRSPSARVRYLNRLSAKR